MNNLLETMFIKRFCLPYNSDIEMYENGDCNISSCLCGNYNHVSCILQGKGNPKKSKILSFGVNQLGDISGNIPGLHAERDAISKLIPLKHKKKLETINIIVVRLSCKNKIQSSKPCSNCIDIMLKLPPKKGYRIQNIYYSDIFGNIIKTTLHTLEKEERHYSRSYRNQRNKTLVKSW
jgi:cytidine deaminase